MVKKFLSCLILLANTAMSDTIEYCKIKYEMMMMQQGVLREKLRNPFYDDYHHVYLRRNSEILSFEPNNKMRVSDDNATLGHLMFFGAECKTVNSQNTEQIWHALKNYYAHQTKTSAYDVDPKGSRKNGHMVAREALNSLGLSLPAMDKTMNPILSTRK